MSSLAARPASLQGSIADLALPDVLQLLDLGKKTGVLDVRRAQIGTDGVIVLVDGRVAGAAVREAGAAEEGGHRGLVARALRGPAGAVEAAVYEVLSWREGRFSFAPLDGVTPSAPEQARSVSVDSLLMESARRDDEWARLASRIPHLGLVPTLLDLGSGAPLDLSPEAWALLAVVDGGRDLRAVAAALGADPLAVARTVDALAAAGVLALDDPAAAPDGDGVPADGARSSSR